jgi:hypothetical protein
MPIDRDVRRKPAAVLLLVLSLGFSFWGVDSRAGTARMVRDMGRGCGQVSTSKSFQRLDRFFEYGRVVDLRIMRGVEQGYPALF